MKARTLLPFDEYVQVQDCLSHGTEEVRMPFPIITKKQHTTTCLRRKALTGAKQAAQKIEQLLKQKRGKP